MRTMMALLYREWIENRSVARTPLWIGIASLALFLWVGASGNIQWSMQYNGSNDYLSFLNISGPSVIVALMVGGLSLLMTTVYFPKTLRKERLEGSFMFWRSMPVSSHQTHISKLIFGLVVIPLTCSGLVVVFDLAVWIIGSMMAGNVNPVGLVQVGSFWIEFLGQMLLIALFLIPTAYLTLLVSQLVSSPLLVLLIIAYAIKWLSPTLLQSEVLSHYVNGIFNIPFKILSGENVWHVITQFGVGYWVLYIAMGVVCALGSISYYATNEFSWHNWLPRKS